MSAVMPTQIRAESFAAYPPQARALVTANLETLRRLPLILVPLLLREAISYDWRFPAERSELDGQLAYLARQSSAQLDLLMQDFMRIPLSADLGETDWINDPGTFSEKLTAHLWATHQMDAFRIAAEKYAQTWQADSQQAPQPSPRMTIVVLGKGVVSTDYVLFRKLRTHGVFFTQVSPQAGLATLLDTVAARAAANPVAYGHWYIDGGDPETTTPPITVISYETLKPVCVALLDRMQGVIRSGTAGPEELRTTLAQLKPEEIGLSTDGGDGVLSHFQMNLLAEGSGTQIFATTFAQWAAREALRRAQPATLLVRFAPRQRQLPMNELLSNAHAALEFDPEGSLIDADMAAYYTWLNQQRLAGSETSVFLAWFEGHQQAVAIGPSLPRGTVSSTPTTLKQILAWLA